MIGLIIYRFATQLLIQWNWWWFGTLSFEEIEAEKLLRKIQNSAQHKQTNYVGLNQIEQLQTLVSTRILKATKKQLFRSPGQIRGSFLARLGIPPSPLISMVPVSPALRSDGFPLLIRAQSNSGLNPQLSNIQAHRRLQRTLEKEEDKRGKDLENASLEMKVSTVTEKPALFENFSKRVSKRGAEI